MSERRISRRAVVVGAAFVLLLALPGCGGASRIIGGADEGTGYDGRQVHELAMLHAQSGRQEEALGVLRVAIAEHPKEPDLHARLGYILRYAGLFEESMQAYRHAIELDSTPRARLSWEGQIAKSLVYLGRYEEAIALQRGLHRHLRELGAAPDEKILFYEGVMLLYAGDRDGAVLRFTEAEVEDPESLWTEFGRAYRDAILGDSASLRARARALLHREVADGERHYRLVHFHSLAGEPEEALKRMQAAFDGGFFAYPYVLNDPLLGPDVRRLPEFPIVLERIQERHSAFRSQASPGTR